MTSKIVKYITYTIIVEKKISMESISVKINIYASLSQTKGAFSPDLERRFVISFLFITFLNPSRAHSNLQLGKVGSNKILFSFGGHH